MDRNIRDLLEAVNFIKDNMVTKAEWAEAETRMVAKIGRVETELGKFQDSEIDKRLQIDVRVSKIEGHLGLSARAAQS